MLLPLQLNLSTPGAPVVLVPIVTLTTERRTYTLTVAELAYVLHADERDFVLTAEE